MKWKKISLVALIIAIILVPTLLIALPVRPDITPVELRVKQLNYEEISKNQRMMVDNYLDRAIPEGKTVEDVLNKFTK